MTELGFDPLDAIASQSAGFAKAAARDLTARVSSCPGWNVADLVAHLSDVHWFWSTVVERHLSTRPEELEPPERADDEQLIARFRAGAEHLVAVLRDADQTEQVYTWAPNQQDVAFVTRHQVQEAAVHHWDAAQAVGLPLHIETPIAVDSIDEFLSFSVSNEFDPADPGTASLYGSLALSCTDSEDEWVIIEGRKVATVRVLRTSDHDAPIIRASSSDLLLWLYKRIDIDTSEVDADVLKRFRELCFTD